MPSPVSAPHRHLAAQPLRSAARPAPMARPPRASPARPSPRAASDRRRQANPAAGGLRAAIGANARLRLRAEPQPLAEPGRATPRQDAATTAKSAIARQGPPADLLPLPARRWECPSEGHGATGPGLQQARTAARQQAPALR
ncbi:hypothetical protein G6F68_013752 [Rhizopus microsporus]|nr:hypothetical protein G6F68_013752 [Rhizopus microsporus]